MTEDTIATARTADGIEIAHATEGPTGGAPLLLVMGIGGQMLAWPAAFRAALVERGFRVTRFDNRDSGLSTTLSALGAPGQLTMLLRPAAAAGYTLSDMAADAIAVLDAQGVAAAHVVGVSQGGMIAQTIAAEHPGRVLSLTSISSAPAPRVGQPRLRTLAAVASIVRRPPAGPEAAAEQALALRAVVGSPGYPPADAERARIRAAAGEAFVRSAPDLAAVQRQTAAIAVSGDRRAALGAVRVPTLVVHGEADPLIRPVAGRATAAAVPGARLVTYPGMGHDLPEALAEALADDIARTAGRA